MRSKETKLLRLEARERHVLRWNRTGPPSLQQLSGQGAFREYRSGSCRTSDSEAVAPRAQRLLPILERSSDAERRHMAAVLRELRCNDVFKKHQVADLTLYGIESTVAKYIEPAGEAPMAYRKWNRGLHAALCWDTPRGLRRDQIVRCDIPQDFFETSDVNRWLQEILEEAERSAAWAAGADVLTPEEGQGTSVLLSPQATGLFVHECFGHRSEADYLPVDAGSREKDLRSVQHVFQQLAGSYLPMHPGGSWVTAQPEIYDAGGIPGWGYTPVDDEGTPAGCTCLYRAGERAFYMESRATAAEAGVRPTGNARAVDFSYAPMVRMTTTFLTPGHHTQAELLSQMDNGIYVENILGGNGLDHFTLIPGRCYRIKQGKIGAPVYLQGISGQVDQALNGIRGRSRDLSYHAMVRGGCGKLDQFPLEVAFGGPYTWVEGLRLW